MVRMKKELLQADLDEYRKQAAEMGITLQEYLLLLILNKLEDIRYS